MTQLVCRDCGGVHKAPFKPERKDFACPCGGYRRLPSELKLRKPLSRVSETGAGKQKGKRGGLKRSQRRESAAEKRARLHFNEVVLGWPCFFSARRKCEACKGRGWSSHPTAPTYCLVCQGSRRHACGGGSRDAHHLIPKDFIRQRCSDWSEPDLLAVLFNPLIGAPLCRKAHEAVESGRDRIYFKDLTPECLEYVGSLPDFMLLRLERECPKRPVKRESEVAS